MKTRTVTIDEAFWFQEGPGVRKWQFTTSGIKLLNVGNILTSGDLDLEKTDRCLSREEVEQRYKHFLVDAGDMVIASSGITIDDDGLLRTRGAFVREAHLPLCLNTSTIRFKSKGDNDLGYLRFWLDSYEFRSQITRLVTGSAQQNFGPSHLENIRITLPDPSEQRRIAERLEQADGLRRTRRYALELSATFLPAAFLQLFGDLRETATCFEQTSFGEVVESNQLGLVRGAAEMRPDFPFDYLRMDGIIGDGRLDLEDLRRVNATPDEVRDFNLQPGDFLFNTRNSRELVGKTALFSECRGTLLFNNNIMRVRFKQTIAPEFMMGLFQSDWLKQNLERIKSGTTNVFAIYYKDLSDLPIVVPPLALQQKFAGLVERVERLRAVQRESLRQAEHLFQSLLHRAFTN